ncbi:1,2-phenylacetyl-CoA epoxidase subunit PaaE [Marinomonas algarum]|uniref:Phenylacetate-CoA oxygenase/reductase subunit PaaK n=1 Tax=Marinomonas algarum TaxID=2883105 RepID=A0A9X1LDU5_9GAMM|nr:1,2-phenylacetyl-CoA epoxidase subunit PaaE [Marinomonas algarum]MCB5160393.1 phenylacetate-CoA oxygenase/reductase subunit PaaK [Marinomonas algarum]
MNQFHPLTIRELRHETRDSVSMVFDVPSELETVYQFKQGQFLTLRTELDGEEVRRSYSICSGVNDGELRVAIKRVPGGLFSTYANEKIATGDVLDVMPPSGHFYTDLDAQNEKNYLLVAAGSGITPILSIAKTTLDAEPNSHVTLIFGNRATSSTMFREQLTDLKNTYMGRFNLIFIFSREQQDIELYNGHIDQEKCQQLFERWVDVKNLDAAFICGPQTMTETVRDTLAASGMPAKDIHFELFAAAGDKRKQEVRAAAAESADMSDITIIRDGVSQTFSIKQNSMNLLDAGNEHGMDLPFSCKAGVCSTCKCKVIGGDVDMDISIGLEDYEVEAGYVLSCQAFPMSKQVVLDFDEV